MTLVKSQPMLYAIVTNKGIKPNKETKVRHVMAMKDPIEKLDSDLRKHEEKCIERHIDIMDKLATKSEKFSTGNWIGIATAVVVTVGLIGGAVWLVSQSIGNLGERIAVVETKLIDIDGNIEEMDKKIEELDKKIDELKETIIQTWNNTDEAVRRAQSSQ